NRWTPNYIFMVKQAAYVQSAIVLNQSGDEVKKPGESIRLTCRTSGYTHTNYDIHWSRQPPGKGVEWIGRINSGSGSSRYQQPFRERFRISEDVSSSTAYLYISSLRVEDTAMYYCAR
uniref:Ig-like domain-containing protein n=1 Tax=Latimeria chalumnae TaxID=7897 RepID=H2ZU26_LATCH